mmetsp:Transcript_36176/g.107431  ORF Transcript_36176/g.107431 Transcript_36176/m.107431 type:complete len:264 (-) Transcript_36176:1131-1922(-)
MRAGRGSAGPVRHRKREQAGRRLSPRRRTHAADGERVLALPRAHRPHAGENSEPHRCELVKPEYDRARCDDASLQRQPAGLHGLPSALHLHRKWASMDPLQLRDVAFRAIQEHGVRVARSHLRPHPVSHVLPGVEGAGTGVHERPGRPDELHGVLEHRRLAVHRHGRRGDDHVGPDLQWGLNRPAGDHGGASHDEAGRHGARERHLPRVPAGGGRHASRADRRRHLAAARDVCLHRRVARDPSRDRFLLQLRADDEVLQGFPG